MGTIEDMGAAIHSRQAHPPLPHEEIDPKKWSIHPKPPKALVDWDGKADTYRLWAARVRDHLVGGHTPWGRVLELLETDRMPMTFRRMRCMQHVDGTWVDPCVLANNLWAFLGSHMQNNPYMRRLTWVNGKEGNGLELWRCIYQECEGGAEQTYLAGISAL